MNTTINGAKSIAPIFADNALQTCFKYFIFIGGVNSNTREIERTDSRIEIRICLFPSSPCIWWAINALILFLFTFHTDI